MLAKGVQVPMTDLFGIAGKKLLAEAPLAPAHAARVESLLTRHHRGGRGRSAERAGDSGPRLRSGHSRNDNSEMCSGRTIAT